MRILCALSLLLLAFAHQPIVGTQPLSTAVEAFEATDNVVYNYALPDGTVFSICLTRNGNPLSDHSDYTYRSFCEACRISASILLPVPQETGGPIVQLASSSEVLITAPDLPRIDHYPPSAPPQAPPVS